MLSSLATKLGLRRLFGGPRWTQRLKSRGMDPLALSVLSSSRDLGDAWARCPRLDWTLELAARAPVPVAMVEQGLAHVLEVAAGWSGAGALRRAREPLRGASEITETRLAELTPVLLALVDGAPEVREALEAVEDAERWRQRARIAREADHYDAVHAQTHMMLADAFRQRVPLDVLRRALGEEPRHPYR